MPRKATPPVEPGTYVSPCFLPKFRVAGQTSSNLLPCLAVAKCNTAFAEPHLSLFGIFMSNLSLVRDTREHHIGLGPLQCFRCWNAGPGFGRHSSACTRGWPPPGAGVELGVDRSGSS